MVIKREKRSVPVEDWNAPIRDRICCFFDLIWWLVILWGEIDEQVRDELDVFDASEL